jgi:hypothetical protein
VGERGWGRHARAREKEEERKGGERKEKREGPFVSPFSSFLEAAERESTEEMITYMYPFSFFDAPTEREQREKEGEKGR